MIEQGIDAGCPILQYQIVDMIRQILPVVVAACVAPCFAAEGWITDMDAAKKQAAEQKKDLMIEFTGSDWCPPCMQLRANVFSKPDFQKEALSAAEANVAKAATDEAKVAALMEVLKLAPQEYVDNFYGDVKAEIKKLDKEDKSGLKAADAHADLLKKEQKDVQNYLAGKLTDKTTPAEALQVVKAYPDRDKLLPETQQQLLMMEFGTYLNSTGDVDGAVLILDKVAELKTGTEAGMQAPRIKAGILANKDKIKAQIDAAKKAQSK